MLPYEMLFSLRRSMCTCARTFIVQQSVPKKSLIGLPNSLTTHVIQMNHESTILLCHQSMSMKNFRRFHTNLAGQCQIQSDNNPTNEKLHLKDEQNIKQEVLTFQSQTTVKPISEPFRKWMESDGDKVPSKEIEKKFPEAKSLIHNMYQVVSSETKVKDALTSTAKKVCVNNSDYWLWTYHVKWPEEKSFASAARSKGSASKSAALKCLYWLSMNGRIRNQKPVIYKGSEQKSLLSAPEELKIAESVLDKISLFLHNYESKISEALSKNDDLQETVSRTKVQALQHPISNRKVDVEMRNESLLEKYRVRRDIVKPDLPIFEYKSKIIEELEKNRVVVIKGDTGCGKTTQVPQFILDHLTEKGQGAECCMIVTQPRRISTISLAQRIAFERSESVGDVIGYQVRLDQSLPKQCGSILFCTAGILLKKMQNNLALEGLSHVVIDEAHERSVEVDMLLVLLKRAMAMNPHLKVVIMSATINADLFQEYLGCSAVEVPGRLFPVEMHFLDDLAQIGIIPRKAVMENDVPVVDCDQIVDLIRWIARNKPPGAILCFLPGWAQILRIQNDLQLISDEFLIVPLHSKLPFINQSQIFDKVDDGTRKIILSTDIAETGLTVPDVVYVIDSACHKETRWHESRGVSSIDTHWISKANLRQRMGRAGRVQKGESYHLLTRKHYQALDEYPRPEVLRVALEETVLACKTYSNEKADVFLGSMPQPPRISAVVRAVEDLQKLGALDQNEDLTTLGRKVSSLSVHPKLGKALVYSIVFQCLNPVATIATVLSMDADIFYGVLEDKSGTRKVKECFHPTSDHIALAWIYAQWADFLSSGQVYTSKFCRKYSLHRDRMKVLHKVREMHLEQLMHTNLIPDVVSPQDVNSEQNRYSILDELVRGILLSGMDQILKYRSFEVKKGRFSKSGSSMVTEDNAKAQLTPQSVNYKRSKWPSPFLTYYQKTHHQERRTTLIRESSMISPVTVLLFSQGQINGALESNEGEDKKVALKIDGKMNVNLTCDERTADTILRFRDAMWSIIRYYVDTDHRNPPIDDTDISQNMDAYRQEMMEVLAHLLNEASTAIDTPEPEPSRFETDEGYGDESDYKFK
ncbi:hypothetical protein QAD02_024412 [Eretmocerus hayati]|uniref:Uncharacterized protein n=1 Tax=Eretmocerus hayati TaxID=131215 RepID=A0ACC2Q231_9HYME|nr:hypothetical protein QAD02_024412 [Eretmocerus hayati]